MSHSQPLAQLASRLWQHISRRRRRQFGLLFILMILGSFAEILSIGAVLPFLAVLTSPTRIFDHPVAQPLIRTLGISSADQLLLPVTVAFALAALLTAAVRLLLIRVNIRLSFAIGADLSLDIYRRTLYQPYLVHAARNSSEVISGISTKANGVVYYILMPFLTLISSCIMLVAILIALLYVDPLIALAAFGGFGVIYALIIRVTRRRVVANSKRIAHETTQVVKVLQEALGGIRDVLIDGSQAAYCQIYRNADLPLRRALGDNLFIGVFPRYGMEALGMILIAGLAYAISLQADGIAKAVPVLGALAVGAQRLLPLLQQGYSSWSTIVSGQASMQDALDLLDQPLPEHAGQPDPPPIPFRQDISLNNLSFRYSADTPWVLRNLNLTIPKGARVGIIGVTGCGKSTLLDIIMDLLQPTEGTLAVDGQAIASGNHRAWQVHIAHVPQAIFLADTSIEENIAFGLPKDIIDHQRVLEAACQAQIADLIESWPKKYQTLVGERGVRLSGGQRQRIGIARALYKQADVIIFDEATSALDQETERSVMQAIEGLSQDLTILIIAHRLTTLQDCDRIIKLGNGGVLRSGSYQSMIDRRTKLNEA
jgi:ATP-binding cassette, subfamily B, bacterial PglK